MSKRIFVAKLLLLLVFISPQLASGQAASTNKSQTWRLGTKAPSFRGKLAPAPDDVKHFFTRLDKPVSLPDLPGLGGAKFRFGLERIQGTSTSIGLRYGTSSSPQQVIDFYKSALRDWKFTSVTDSDLTATKAGKKVNVVIMPKGSSDVQTDFMINYSYNSR